MYVLRSEVGSRPSSRPVIPTSINMSKCINYMAFETAELLQQMRDGINVPSNPPEQRSWSWTEKKRMWLIMSNYGLGMTALRDFDADLVDMLLQGLATEVLLWQLSLSQRAAM
jgi:hypothetical protein